MTTPFDAACGEPCEKCPENRANYPAGRLTPAEAVAAIGELRARREIPAETGALEAGEELWAQLLRLPVL
jgi:hypothetical protein